MDIEPMQSSRAGRKRTGLLITVVFGLLFLGVLVYSTIGLGEHTVEVCVAFNGQEVCRTASATTRESAQRTATANACALITRGMTESIACAAKPPAKITWSGESAR